MVKIMTNKIRYAEYLYPPKHYADCMGKPEPCRHVFCEHHMVWCFIWGKKPTIRALLDKAESLKYTCVLKAVEKKQGGLTLQEVGDILGITRERIRQIEEEALRKIGGPKIRKQLEEYANNGR
jgi:hypothetical protein